MAIALVTSIDAAPGNGGGTTGSFDSSGGDLIVVGISSYGMPTASVTDNKGNTYTALTGTANGPSGAACKLYYCANPTVGTGHTVTFSQGLSYPVISVAVFSGVTTTSPFDVENGANSTTNTSLAPGSVTPTANGEVLISVLSLAAAYSGLGIDSSFSIAQSQAYSGGNNMGGAIAYYVQPTAAAINPTWSWTSSVGCATTIASFKAAAAAANPVGVIGGGVSRVLIS